MSDLPQGPASRRVDPAGVVIALALAALAAVLVWDASQLQSNNPYGMGPHVMPIVIAVGLGLLAIGNLVDALRGNLPARESADPKAVWLILGGSGAADRHHRPRRRLYPGDHGIVRRHGDGLWAARCSRRPRHRLRADHPDLCRLQSAADLEPSRRPAGKAVLDGRLRRTRQRHGRRDPAHEPALCADRRAARHRGRRAARHRSRAHRRVAVAGDLQARSRRLADHVRRHLLRRHVWRIDHRHPDQHARRERIDGDRAGGQQDGQGRPRRSGAGDGGDRLVRRRHHRHHWSGLSGAVAGRLRCAISGRKIILR